MLPILFSDTGATSQDGSHSAIFRMQGPEGCDSRYPANVKPSDVSGAVKCPGLC